jgi:hypothetical protein
MRVGVDGSPDKRKLNVPCCRPCRRHETVGKIVAIITVVTATALTVPGLIIFWPGAKMPLVGILAIAVMVWCGCIAVIWFPLFFVIKATMMSRTCLKKSEVLVASLRGTSELLLKIGSQAYAREFVEIN